MARGQPPGAGTLLGRGARAPCSAFGQLCPAVTPQVLLPELTHLGVGASFTLGPDSKSLNREVAGFPPHRFYLGSPQRHCVRGGEHTSILAAPSRDAHDGNGTQQPHGHATGISVPGSRKSHFSCWHPKRSEVSTLWAGLVAATTKDAYSCPPSAPLLSLPWLWCI